MLSAAKHLFIGLLSISCLASCKNQDLVTTRLQSATHLIIRKMDYPIVKRPDMPTERKALLLEVWPGGGETMATPYIEVVINGTPTMCAFRVVKVFKSDKQALRHARKRGITDVNLNP